MPNDAKPQRILLKLSGEALMGGGEFGIDPAVLHRVAVEIAGLVEQGLQIGLVIGGGNIFRGAGLAGGGFDRVTGDMLKLQDGAIQESLGVPRVRECLSWRRRFRDWHKRLSCR